MLRLMLAAHSRLTIPPETWFLIPLVQRFSVDRPLSADDVESAVSMITSHDRWPYMKLDAHEFRRRVGRLKSACLRDLVGVVYQWQCEAEGKARCGDKTPPYIAIVPSLARMYPEARFVHLVRDGRDVALSFRDAGWIDGHWVHDYRREWIQAIKYQRRLSRSELSERILLIRYEELVLRTEPTLREICRFIGEEFEPQMLSWDRIVDVDAHVPVRERKQHAKLKQKIGADGIARWKREMSTRAVFMCEAFMSSHLRWLGYELRYSNRLWRPAFGVARMCACTLLPAALHLRNRLVSLVGST
jgi:hypothetical protein